MELKDAIGLFFVEFAQVEGHCVGQALRALSDDALFVEQAESLLDLEARLKLLERMAFARGVPAAVISELEACLVRARLLRQHRDAVARSLAARTEGPKPQPVRIHSRPTRRRDADFARLAKLETLVPPAVSSVREYADEARALQAALATVTRQLERHVNPAAATG